MSASLAKISIINLCALSFIGACNSKEVVTDAQCSSEEQGMFLACLESGCSASYTQDLSGTDACSIEGGGSLVSVEAGGECGFTSSGSCYVICDCPEGVGLKYNVNGENENNTNWEGDDPGECSDGADNDRDSLYDCDDSDCAGSPDCSNPEDVNEDTGGDFEDTVDSDTGTDDSADPDEDDFTDEDGDFYTVEDGDCNDRNPSINPSATDIVGDSIDQNCDGIDGTDIDRDGFASESSGGSDCDDFNVLVNPDYGVADIEDYIDSNCDGVDGLASTYKALFLDGLTVVENSSGGPMRPMDFDGDGFNDLILKYSSSYYILFGSTINSATTDTLTVADMDLEIHFVGTAYFREEFYSKDIDGDGGDDLAFNWDDKSYIYYSSTITSSTNLIPGSNEDVVFRSVYTYGYSSITYSVNVSLMDDVTGDGIADIHIDSNNDQIVTSIQAGSGGNIATLLLGTRVYNTVGPQLGGFDPDSDGKPDFLNTYCYSSTTGYRDIDSVGLLGSSYGSCNGYFGTFVPTMVLNDIDENGEKELSDGRCIMNISTFSSGGTCDYSTYYIHYDWSFFDINDDGKADTYYGNSIILDALGSASYSVPTADYLYALGDFNGDGKIDPVFNRHSYGTSIVGIK